MNNSMESLFKIIEKDIGYKESPAGSNNTKFGESTGMNYQPWCVSALYYWFKEAGLSDIFYDGKKVASCTLVYNWAKKNGLIVEIPQRGDIVIFDWKHDGKPDHIGIIERTNGATLYTIEGNTGDNNASDGDGVYRRTRKTSSVYCYIRPKYGKKTYIWTKPVVYLPQLSKGDKNEYVAVLQSMLNAKGFNCGEVDGDFGSNTFTAIKNFQKATKITQDSIVGLNTWSALFKKQ